MEDLTQYIPRDNEWMRDISTLMGEERLAEYYNRVFLRLYGMKHKECLYVLREVSPDNYKLFIQVVCAVINELTSYGIYEFFLENQATMVYRD